MTRFTALGRARLGNRSQQSEHSILILCRVKARKKEDEVSEIFV